MAASIEELLARLKAAEARLAQVEGVYPAAKYFNTRFVAGLQPAANQVPLWDGSRIKYVPTTLVPGTGLPAWATTEIADVAATEGAGSGTLLPRADHVHAHQASQHQAAGAMAVALDTLAAPTDITTLNATTSVHGLLLKLGGGTTNFLRADGTWNAPAGGGSITAEYMITPWSAQSIGVNLGALASAAPASAVWPAANRALYVPFTLDETVTVVKMFAYNGATAAGTTEISIYNAALSRQFAAGSAAQAGTNQIQEFDTADTSLAAGRYYMALMNTLGTSTFFRIAPAVALLESLAVAQEATGGTLPATATLALAASAYLPYFGLSLRTLVT